MNRKITQLILIILGIAILLLGHVSFAAPLPDPNISVKGYFANDKAQRGRTVQAAVVIEIPSGYHINSNRPLESFLIATSLKIDLERRGLAELATSAADIEKLLEESVKEARTLAHGLVPVELDEAGLNAALQELVSSTRRLFGIDCTFEFAGNNGSRHFGRASHLYRIAQEAINNATKHAQARHIEVRLSANSNALSLSIADDGTGFAQPAHATSGVGISIMRYRANVLGGNFEIEDRPSGGTIVSCVVPATESNNVE